MRVPRAIAPHNTQRRPEVVVVCVVMVMVMMVCVVVVVIMVIMRWCRS